MIKEFECTKKGEPPVVFEVRFTSYEQYAAAYQNRTIACPYCLQTSDIKVAVSRSAPPQFKGTGFYSTDYK